MSRVDEVGGDFSGRMAMTGVRRSGDPAQIAEFRAAYDAEPSAPVQPPSRCASSSSADPHLAGQSLSEQLLRRYASPGRAQADDVLSLRAFIKQQIPTGKQQEAALFQVLSDLRENRQADYLSSLIKPELNRLITRNAMIANIMKNSYRLELES